MSQITNKIAQKAKKKGKTSLKTPTSWNPSPLPENIYENTDKLAKNAIQQQQH